MKSLHTSPFSAIPHLHRREQLIKRMRTLGGGIALIPTAPEVIRNRDAHYDFRPDSTFIYLTGFNEPEALLVLVVSDTEQKSILFCREKNMEREIWDGYRFGPAAAQEYLCVDQAFSFDELAQHLPTLMSNQTQIFAPLFDEQYLGGAIKSALNIAKSNARNGAITPTAIKDVYALTDEMRLIKDDTELAWLRCAGKISAQGHIKAMQSCQAGLRETDLEAEILYHFARSGAQHPAYNTIVAGGSNACVLHYRAGSSILKDGDLCLIDAGAEYGYYAGDITRTFPVNGKFSGPQRAVYEIVLAAQQAAIDTTRAGVAFTAPHGAAVRVLTQGMFDLKLLNHDLVGSLDDAIAHRDYQDFYMHRTSHWIGLDVHDCGAYSSGQNEQQQPIWRTLQERMTLTIEPGLYIRPAANIPENLWNIDIRIEDDAIVTPHGCELTTRDVPVNIDDIEYLMKHSEQHE